MPKELADQYSAESGIEWVEWLRKAEQAILRALHHLEEEAAEEEAADLLQAISEHKVRLARCRAAIRKAETMTATTQKRRPPTRNRRRRDKAKPAAAASVTLSDPDAVQMLFLLLWTAPTLRLRTREEIEAAWEKVRSAS